MSDDLDDDNMDLDESSFDDFGSDKGATLGDMWRNNPIVKVGVVGAAAIAIFGTIMLFSGKEADVDQSFIPAGSDIKAPPGTKEASPAYIAAVEEETEARIEEAFRTKGSALPTPIDPPVGRLQVPEEENTDEDPLQRWRQLQEKRVQMELQNTENLDLGAPPDESGQNEAIQALADAMSEQMQAILERQSEVSVQSMNLTDPEYSHNALKRKVEKRIELAELECQLIELEGGSCEDGEGGGDGFFEDEELEDFGTVLLPAAEIVYAQLLTEANSDAPGPVLAQIVSGPLAGNRIIGSFEVENDLLILNFGTLVIDGASIGVSAIALDPATTLPGMATEVDHRYLQRIALPMAAAFVEGVASAVAETGQTTITINSDSGGASTTDDTENLDSDQEIATGVEEAGEELRDILDEMIEEVEVLVRIEAGTPIGILFLEPVVDGEEG